ncbi:HC-toxin synthetase [Pyrenophora tritici-repentis]|nr:HC-toxin synthetase [Pyrenophora tritici-repentis]
MQGQCNSIKRQPETEIEYKLQRVWSQVLNIRPDEIGLDDSLFRLGGDSISAMQVVSLCRTDGIILTTKDVMKGKDIRRLAKLVKFARSSEVDAESLEMEQAGLPFELSPIQQMYIQAFPGRDECFDQCFYLRLNKPVSPSAIARALGTVVQQHAMLRARIIEQSDGTWRQIITNDIQGSLQWRHHRLVNDNPVGEIIADSRRSLDFGKGPVLTADLFSINEAQTFFITVHHLFVDLVSWRIILQDIEQLVLTGSMPSLPTIPFQSWCQLQRTYAHRHLTPKLVLPFQIKPPMISYWGINDHWGTWSDTVKHEFNLDARTTASILGECNEGLRTEPVELFIAGLIQSFSQVFQDRDVPTIFSEGHGREPWDDNIDLSRTVGWFTTLSPVNCATTSTGNIKDTIRRTKDGRRSLSHKGWGYFASRFHNPEGIEAFKQQSPIEVLVNYQGLYQQLERQDTLFQRSDAPSDQDLDVSLQGGRFALFVVSIVVQNGKAIVSFIFNRKAKHQDRIAHWIQNYETTMQDIVAVMHNEDRKYTLSDFPTVFRDYRDLDKFTQKTLPSLGVSNIEDVENIYQCSPMQQAILLNRIDHPNNYWIHLSFKVVPSSEQPTIDVPQIQRAWQAVVERHAVLRTVFVLDSPGVTGSVQVVLRNRKVGTEHVKINHPSTTVDLFKDHRNVLEAQRHGLEHHLTIYELLDGTVFCILEISHAIVDGHSFAIIHRDLSAAYSDSLQLEVAPPYSDFVSFIQQEDFGESLEYWKRYLDGVEPCLFPSSSVSPDEVDQKDNILKTTVHFDGLATLRSFCKKYETTPFTVVQLAWALVLGTFSNTRSQCFGYLSSGRQLPIDQIDSIAGPTINMLTCRVDIQSSCEILEALRKLQTDVTESNDHQLCSLASVQHALKLDERRLFNTAITYQRHNSRSASHSKNITIQTCDEYDPTEYSIVLHVDEYDSSFELACSYHTSRVSSLQAKSIADTIGHTILAIVENPGEKLGNLNRVGKSDMKQLWAWNQDVPPAFDRCVHDLFAEQANTRPDAPAVCAWDGELTYGELDALSTKLAGHLVQLGVKLESLVPLCFEKSMWTVVAMLAVLKAGGAFVPLDPDHPASRHDEIFKQTNAKMVLASAQYATFRASPSRRIVTVSEASTSQLSEIMDTPISSVKPENAAYIIFTSGSTGVPKGVVLEHRAVVTSCLGHGQAFGITDLSRVLQFASYTFDACIAETITTLVYGGCICVPSDSDRRNDLAEAINVMDVNWAFLTPSVARLLNPGLVPSLKILVLGGEQVSSADWDRWPSGVQTINGYGPTECCVFCIGYSSREGFKSGIIGTSVASVSWVVDPEQTFQKAS